MAERLALAGPVGMDRAIDDVLGLLAEATGASRIWLAEVTRRDAIVREACAWSPERTTWESHDLPGLPAASVADLLAALDAGDGTCTWPAGWGGGRTGPLLATVGSAGWSARTLLVAELRPGALHRQEEARRLFEPIHPLLAAAVARRQGENPEASTCEVAAVRHRKGASSDAAHRLRLTFEHAAVGLGHLDREGRWVLVNERLCQMLGRAREDLLGHGWEECSHPDDLDRSRRAVDELVAGDVPSFSLEKRYVRGDGSEMWGRVTVSAVPDDRGAIDYRIVALQDIDAEQRIAQALRASAERNRAMREAIPDLVFRLDRGGVYVDFHAPDEMMLYTSPDAIIGRRVRDVLPPHVAQLCMDALAFVTAHPGVLRQFDYTLSVHGDRERHYEARMVASSPDEVWAIVRDVTTWKEREADLMEARRQAEVANRAKSDFLAKMSHELRTPLNGVLGFSELLEQELFGPLNDRQRGFVENILTSGRHLLSLVDDVLDLAKVEAGRLSMSREWTPLSDIVDGVWRVVQPMADKAGVALEARVPDDFPAMYVDPRRIRQVLYNLLSNGIKFTPSGGWVTLRARAEPRWFRLEVEDTGCGIDPEDMPRLFREFEQASSGPRERPEGTGLGLALTRRLVTLHGGTVDVRSRPGEGATFIVSLPRVAESGEAVSGSHVLVVDDDVRAASLVERLLEARGVDTNVARSGEEALAMVTRSRPDAVLVEITTPGVQDDFARRVAARWPEDPVPIIALTVADAEPRCEALDVTDHLVKPFAHRELLLALECTGACSFPEVES
ncbi:MAG: PAS domain-containing hybrid sensor histidine kinase/response regulator [Myxococcota bacterium]